MDEPLGERIRVYLRGTVLDAVVVNQDGTTPPNPLPPGHYTAILQTPRAELPARES